MTDILLAFKEAFDPDREPLPDIAICSECGWRGHVSECQIAPHGDGDWETGYHPVHLCPICEDGGCIDNYDMSDERAKEWEKWFKGKDK